MTNVFKLSKYFDGIEGTIADTDVFELKGAEEGGKTLIIAGTHANEPSALYSHIFSSGISKWKREQSTLFPISMLAVLLEHSQVEDFSLLLSGNSMGRTEVQNGRQRFQALDQWPDPDVYVHIYPDGQLLSYIDARNTNRSWPGSLTDSLLRKYPLQQWR